VRPIRVFVADDHAVVRDGLVRILDAVEDMCCAGTAEDGRQVLERAEEESWDVLILDLSGLGPGGGLDVLHELTRTRPDLPIVVYSMYPEEQYGARMLRAGAAAYLGKGRATSELLEAIRKVAGGGRFVTEEIAERLIAAPDASELTDRELQIVELLAGGSSTNEIGYALSISASTVSTHLRHIKDKLGARTQAEIVRLAIVDGLVQAS